MKLQRLFLFAIVLSGGVVVAEIQTETLQYREGDTVLQAFIAHDSALPAPRPGVRVVHEWYGVNEHAMNTARKLAELGYVGFALDMYGADRRTSQVEEAGQWSGEIKSNPELMRARFQAAFDVIRDHPLVNPRQIAALGYCFGGTVVLEMARAGLDLDGVVSFHGGLGSAWPEAKREISTKVLVLHGADDPYVPEEEVAAFQQEMRDAGADWQFIAYGNAVHSFTNPKASLDGARYEERAARRSWEATVQFLRELFPAP